MVGFSRTEVTDGRIEVGLVRFAVGRGGGPLMGWNALGNGSVRVDASQTGSTWVDSGQCGGSTRFFSGQLESTLVDITVDSPGWGGCTWSESDWVLRPKNSKKPTHPPIFSSLLIPTFTDSIGPKIWSLVMEISYRYYVFSASK